ncbi:hypothetical protein RRG08_015616 [Elysia crispata]|uniref:Reverse transcriptase zinc-binding domain-containing protein n=1 Tax=Elysia crispata TaxID=231223 RepID=A0AAE0YHK5_9GAST|nr:hypothetical protein RRG08_015616 [Elysia crispata]
MAPLRICFLIRSVYDLLPSNANLVRWGKKEDRTCPLCQGRQTTEQVLSSCKIALSQGRYTLRHNRVLQELAAIISTAKGETTLPNTNALIFKTEGGAKSWHGRPDQLAKWYSAGISNPSRDEGVGSNPGAVQEKKDNRETPGSHDLVWSRPLRVSEVKGRS